MAEIVTTSTGAQFETVWTESFDDGPGMLSRAWGNVDTSVAGQVTLTSYEHDGYTVDSGAMVPPTGADAGYGYGLYSFSISMDGDAPGPYALLWPGTDIWPGPELDLVEVGNDGSAYSTIHSKGDDGGNAYATHMLDGVDPSQPHDYALEWAADHISVYVDNQLKYTTTENVPKDHADGGENLAPGFGMQTWWSVPDQHGDNHITAYDVSYAAPVEGGTVPAPETAPVPAPAPAEPALVTPEAPATEAPAQAGGEIDWQATSAAVTAHFEATGQWGHLEDFYVYHGDAPAPEAPAPAPAEPPVATPAPEPDPVQVPAPDAEVHGLVDWAATSALVTAHFEATGQWGSLDDFTVYVGGADHAAATDHPFG